MRACALIWRPARSPREIKALRKEVYELRRANEILKAASTALPPAFAPGSRFGYSTTNFLVLRMVIEAAAGQPFPALLQGRIFTPLGLRSTSVDDRFGIAGNAVHGYIALRLAGAQAGPRPDRRGAVELLGGMGSREHDSTARDLARFLRAGRRKGFCDPTC
jgi:CubicO group peptidase (beta-lactamase class C family)